MRSSSLGPEAVVSRQLRQRQVVLGLTQPGIRSGIHGLASSSGWASRATCRKITEGWLGKSCQAS